MDDSARKVEIGVAHKDSGNALFVRGDYTGALREYHLAVLHLSGLDRRAVDALAGGGAPSAEPAGSAQLALVRANMAACYLRVARYDRAVQSAEQALALEPTNQKAIFRKAQALRLQGELHAAREFLTQPHARAYAEHPDFVAEATRISTEIRAREQKSAAALRGFLR